MLIGLAAAAIPWLLHLLSSVRAQEVFFPTLRFLRLSMEKTARRRRIQHWLLLLVRSVLLAMLCLAVAQPLSRAGGNWLGSSGGSAAIVLDNSYSMAARDGQVARFDRARNQAAALLSGDDKPALAALLTTNGGMVSTDLSANMATLRDGLSHAAVGYGSAPLAQRVAAAADLLEKKSSSPTKAVYVFSDLQRGTFDELLNMEALLQHKGLHLMVIDAGSANVNNVGITDLEIAGRRAVDSVLEFSARLVNSSPMDRVVTVGLRVEGHDVGAKVRLNLSAAGKDGHIGTARFRHAFAKAGSATGEVYIEQADDLPMDNVRRFALEIGGRVNALVVRGPRAGDEPWWADSGGRILVALQPFADKNVPWPIVSKIVESEAFTPADLAGDLDVAFFSDVATFTNEQAAAIRDFARKGGTAVFFLGPNTSEADYNDRLASGPEPLLPAKLAGPVGEIGAAAAAQRVDWLDMEDPVFRGLFAALGDYFASPLQAQRYFRLAEAPKSAKVLMRLKDGSPLLLVQAVGAGRSFLCTTTSSPRWSNLSSHPLFLPLANRLCLLARQDPWRDATYTVGSQVRLRLPAPAEGEDAPADIEVRVTVPPIAGEDAPSLVKIKAARTPEGYVATFSDTQLPGLYRYQAAEASGAFAVNPQGQESNLESMPPDEFVKAMQGRGFDHVYVAPTVVEANALASSAAEGRNWWDTLAALAIVLLVIECVIANRKRMRQDIVPAHLNPSITR